MATLHIDSNRIKKQAFFENFSEGLLLKKRTISNASIFFIGKDQTI